MERKQLRSGIEKGLCVIEITVFIPNMSFGFSLYSCFILSVFPLDILQAQRAMSRKNRQKEADRKQNDG